jgi:hypothetical protein
LRIEDAGNIGAFLSNAADDFRGVVGVEHAVADNFEADQCNLESQRQANLTEADNGRCRGSILLALPLELPHQNTSRVISGYFHLDRV